MPHDKLLHYLQSCSTVALQHTLCDLMGADHSVLRVRTSFASHPLQGAGCDQLVVFRADVDAVLCERRSQQHEAQRYLRVKSDTRAHGRDASLRKKCNHLTSIRCNHSLTHSFTQFIGVRVPGARPRNYADVPRLTRTVPEVNRPTKWTLQAFLLVT